MIGIFGDSFGYQFVKEALLGIQLFGQTLQEEVENFSLFATAINYSYERFIHKMDTEPNRYSKIVFVCTNLIDKLLEITIENKKLLMQVGTQKKL